ncbi:hypothetical protein pb186bvf_000350 [Paramecium bursaria]
MNQKILGNFRKFKSLKNQFDFEIQQYTILLLINTNFGHYRFIQVFIKRKFLFPLLFHDQLSFNYFINVFFSQDCKIQAALTITDKMNLILIKFIIQRILYFQDLQQKFQLPELAKNSQNQSFTYNFIVNSYLIRYDKIYMIKFI